MKKLILKLPKKSIIDDMGIEILRNNPDATIWDILVEILSKGNLEEKYKIWILSDIETLELVARGHSIYYIAEYLSLSTQEINAKCRIWGMVPLDDTSDFDPVEMYSPFMEFLDYSVSLEPFRESMHITDEQLRLSYENAKRYITIKELLDQWEDE